MLVFQSFSQQPVALAALGPESRALFYLVLVVALLSASECIYSMILGARLEEVDVSVESSFFGRQLSVKSATGRQDWLGCGVDRKTDL